jgi:uncharacterized protein YraI
VLSAIANLRSGPDTSYPIVRTRSRGRVIMIAEVRGDWLRAASFRPGRGPRWIHKSNVQLTRLADEAPQAP